MAGAGVQLFAGPTRHTRVRLLALGSFLLALLLSACGPAPGEPTAPTPDAVPAPARAFLDFASGADPAAVPWAARVVYSVEGQVARTLSPTTASSRRSWRVCPRGTATLEGRSCPVDVLRLLAVADRGSPGVVLERHPPRGGLGCTRYVDPTATDPAGEDRTTFWLRPPEDRRSCFEDLAVAVPVSAAGRVVAVDLAVSGP